MGGHVFPETEGKRIPRDEYLEYEKRVLDILRGQLGLDARVPPYTSDKPTFGDLDIIVQADRSSLSEKVLQSLDPLLEIQDPTKHRRWMHSNILSCLAFGKIQCDMILCPDPEAMDFMVRSYSYSDVMGILGAVTHTLGMALSPDGIYMRLFWHDEKTEHCGKLFLTHSWPETMDLLGMDAARYERGFENEADLFTWLTTSPLFSRDGMCRQESLNSEKRKRGRKRPLYQRFLKFLNDNPDIGSGERPSVITHEGFRKNVLNRFGLTDIYNQIMHRMDQMRQASEKFNARHVMKLTGLENDHARLSPFMAHLQRKINEDMNVTTTTSVMMKVATVGGNAVVLDPRSVKSTWIDYILSHDVCEIEEFVRGEFAVMFGHHHQ